MAEKLLIFHSVFIWHWVGNTFLYFFSTALSKATLDGNIDVVKYLIDHGADPKAGKMPSYEVVSMYGKQEVAEYLRTLEMIW